MPYGLYISAEGAHAQSLRLDAIANNIANIDTPGFKRQFALFQARYTEQIEAGRDMPGSGSINDIGGGVWVRETKTDHSQGPLKTTGIPTDFAVRGEGFFVVDRDGESLLTRAGNFTLTNEGQLVTAQGYPVLAAGGGAIVLPQPNQPFQVSGDGMIQQQGVQIPLALVNPENDDELAQAGENFFQAEGQVNDVDPTHRSVVNGFLETSGANATTELVEMIEASRAIEANLKLMEIQDQMMGGLVNRVLGQR